MTPLVVYWVIIATVGPSEGGWTIQPSRQPVIAHDLEKLLITISRSSGSAMSRMVGAEFRPNARRL